MKAILLNLSTPAGDELGPLPLTSVVLAAGEAGPSGTHLPRRTQFESLLSDLYTTLEASGLRCAQTPAEVEFAASLALLAAVESDVTIPITVHPPTPHLSVPEGGADSKPGTSAGIRWEDLLRLNDAPEETDHA
jgi:hypothetical protein